MSSSALPSFRVRTIVRAAALVLLSRSAAEASGLRIVAEKAPRIDGGAIVVTVDVSWDRSWRDDVNHDAAWVVLKYRAPSGALRPATLAAGGHRMEANRHAGEPAPEFIVPPDRSGAFLARSAAGRGRNDWRLALVWDHARDGVDAAQPLPEVAAFGVEMVFIPGGAFVAGDPPGDEKPVSALELAGGDGTSAGPFPIGSEGEIRIGSAPGNLHYAQSERIYQGDQRGRLPRSFPKGTAAFYVMKYETQQGEYAAFVDALPDTATSFRAIHAGRDYGAARGTFALDGRRYVARRPGRGGNYLSWEDGIAFADFMALRPLTELEFEKACRGERAPENGEFPWGTGAIQRTTRLLGPDGALARTEDGTERADGNAHFGYPFGSDAALEGGDGGRGPLRSGIFEAAAPPGDRAAAGASRYGVMELAGNVWERCVTIGDPAGRAFDGSHGDGRVSPLGDATNEAWPRTGHGGYGYRGGAYYNDERALMVADRRFAAWASGGRGEGYGFRAARTAPGEVRVAFVGNSLTRTNDLPAVLARLSSESRLARTLVPAAVMAEDGMTLARHAATPGRLEAIERGRFDFVILQENGRVAASGDDAVAAGSIEAARALAAAARRGGATPVFYMTWGAASDAVAGGARVAAAYARLGRECDAVVAPAGLAFARAAEIAPDLALRDPDGEHPAPLGTALAASVLHAALHGHSPEAGALVRCGFDERAAALLAESVADARRGFRQPRGED